MVIRSIVIYQIDFFFHVDSLQGRCERVASLINKKL